MQKIDMPPKFLQIFCEFIEWFTFHRKAHSVVNQAQKSKLEEKDAIGKEIRKRRLTEKP